MFFDQFLYELMYLCIIIKEYAIGKIILNFLELNLLRNIKLILWNINISEKSS